MNFLPVITRELQVQARQRTTHRMRWIAAGAVMTVWIFLMIFGGRATPQERAQIVFIAIGLCSLGFVMLAGVFQTADCLSQERREGTLGLLFLTDLKGYDVVLGKLASTSLNSFYTFLAVVPVMALPFLMGGITGGEFWRVTLVLVATLFLSLALGMLVSALSRDARAAMGGTVLLLLTVSGLLPGLWWLLTGGTPASNADFLRWTSPPYAFRVAFDDVYSVGQGAVVFWSCIATFLAIGTASLLGASWLLPRYWQDTKGCNSLLPGKRRSFLPRSWRARLATRHQQLRGRQPLLWLTTRDSRPQRMAFWAFALLLPAWIYFLGQLGSANKPTQDAAFVIVISVTYGLHLIVKCLVAAEASRLLGEERQSGALELLLVAPLSVQHILTSQVRGIWISFRRWVGLLTIMNLAVIWFTIQSNLFQQKEALAGYLIMAMAGGALLLFLDGCAIVNVGMWMAVLKKRQAAAVVATLRRVLLPPWLLGVFFFLVGIRNASAETIGGALIFWFIISFLVNVFVTIPALRSLQKHFREVAALGNLESKLPAMSGATIHPQASAQ